MQKFGRREEILLSFNSTKGVREPHTSIRAEAGRGFIAAVIDQPVRVEKRSLEGKDIYQVVGILCGGVNSARCLAIQFNPQTNFMSTLMSISIKQMEPGPFGHIFGNRAKPVFMTFN